MLLGLAPPLGLGVFVPANNAVIMRSAPAGSAAVLGGLVNMARGIGTTFGIALVTLALHLAGSSQASGGHARRDHRVRGPGRRRRLRCRCSAMSIRPLAGRAGIEAGRR